MNAFRQTRHPARQPSRTQLQQPSRTQLQQPSPTQLQQPSRTQPQQPSPTQLQQPSRTQPQQPSRTQLRQPSRIFVVIPQRSGGICFSDRRRSFRRTAAAMVLALLSLPLSLPAQAIQTLPSALQTVLDRESNGHSPTDQDIADIGEAKPTPTPEDLRAAAAIVPKLLANPDSPARTFALTALISLEAPAAQPTAAAGPPPAGPAVFPAATAQALASAIPAIAARLADDLPGIRALAATVLGGFTPNPPAAIYPPLLAFLKREDAPGAIGQAVVVDLLQLGPLTPEVADAIARFLHRADQDSNTRANLIEAIATAPNQSQSLNKSMLSFLSSDDPSLRARVILSLPALDLAPDVYADIHTRVAQLVDDPGENLQVLTAAKAVAPCWTATKMTTGCPVY